MGEEGEVEEEYEKSSSHFNYHLSSECRRSHLSDRRYCSHCYRSTLLRLSSDSYDAVVAAAIAVASATNIVASATIIVAPKLAGCCCSDSFWSPFGIRREEGRRVGKFNLIPRGI